MGVGWGWQTRHVCSCVFLLTARNLTTVHGNVSLLVSALCGDDHEFVCVGARTHVRRLPHPDPPHTTGSGWRQEEEEEEVEQEEEEEEAAGVTSAGGGHDGPK